MPLLARVWGCRGSIPTPGEATVRYGGNTTCVEIRTGDEVVSIPMDGGVESLNVAMAGTLLLFEAARQRRANQ